MPFFIPERLTAFKLFDVSSKADDDIKEYEDVLSFAFFVVHFGYTKSEYDQLTPLEKLMIMKAYEDKVIEDTSSMYRAVITATYNVNRGKGKRALKLFDFKSKKVADKQYYNETLKAVQENIKNEGMDWIKKIKGGV